ncbi:hypothetical protein K0H71_21330 [Bacillus sp. IITD106]|nr:hypothetical protein [Bacillus sp. IITD106]
MSCNWNGHIESVQMPFFEKAPRLGLLVAFHRALHHEKAANKVTMALSSCPPWRRSS